MRRLPDSELELMMIIWELDGPVTRFEIEESMEKDRKLSPTTILSFLSRLQEKGFLKVEKTGKNNVYISLIGRDEYMQSESRKILKRLYRNSARNFLAALYDGNSLTDEEWLELEEYISEELLDRVGMTYFNSGVSGMLTGLGILGTFLGLSLGLGSFRGDDIYTISDNVGPLLSGMKVAFHTSVYGILFSLIFNLVYRSVMADAYEKLESFLFVFRQTTQPQAAREDENNAVMVVYQAGMLSALKQMVELMKGEAREQTAGLERIVDKFTERMQISLGADFERLGGTLKRAGEAQAAGAANARELMEALTVLVEVNQNVQSALATVMDRQEEFAGELREQKEKLEEACKEMSSEISSQLYAFDKMRGLYE